jgi:2-haloacid dehalogenase
MTAKPTLILFDVNETLSDLSPMAARFADVGAPGLLAKAWFASVLRDGFALTTVGENPAFAELAKDCARTLLSGEPLDRDVDDAVGHVMAGFTELTVHPDVADGIRALADLGIRLATLTNGATAVAEQLLAGADLSDHFERYLSVSDAPAWKPVAAAYDYGVAACGVEARDAMLVAVHPWDIDGAARAGLRTAWVDRLGTPYPGHFTDPELHVRSVLDLADQLR